MTLLFVALPVVSLGWALFVRYPAYLLCGNMGVLCVVAGVNLYEVAVCGAVKRVTLLENFLPTAATPYTGASLGVYLDYYSAHMVWVVFFISFMVHLYSLSYMGADPRVKYFLIYLTLFTFFMVVLLVAPNYVQLFCGWEGVGLTSYLLVNFWHTRTAANKSALKALIVNRVGDVFLLYAIFLMVSHGHTVEYTDLAVDRHPLVAPFIVAAVAAKSAQLGLHTWLPDAMEGPTPVSALIHAATMVTAGVFLLFRSPQYVEQAAPVLVGLGAITTLFAGSVALVQFDLKRIIAYSTCSQLGYMVVAVGLDYPELGLYHLANHAYFKALLFLLAGLVIHAVSDEQDVRRMGGLVRVLPVTYTLFGVGSLALGGFPFLSGFYSKEGILEALYARGEWFAYFCTVAAAVLTAFYSFRTVYLVFFGPPRGDRPVYTTTTEADPLSLGVVLTLGALAVGHGYVGRDLFVGWGTTLGWSTPGVTAEFAVPLGVKLLPLGLSFVGVALAYGFAVHTVGLPGMSVAWYSFFAKRWWWDYLDSTAARRFTAKSYRVYTGVERGLFEWVGPSGVSWVAARGYQLVRTGGWFPTFFASIGVGLLFFALFNGWGYTTGAIPVLLPFGLITTLDPHDRSR